MKKIDSKQALLQFLRERIEAARVDTNIRGFDEVLSVLRLTDFSKQANGYSSAWVGHRVDESISVPARTEGYISSDTHHVPSCMDLFIRETDNLYSTSSGNYMEGFVSDSIDRLFELANLVIPDSGYWVWRENTRFLYGDYAHALFVDQLHTLSLHKTSEYWWHFPHISVEEPALVAYTPSPDYGQRDRQVRVKIGRYLQQFYGDVLTSEQIRSMANGLKTIELNWARDRDEMVHVYKTGPGSCMAKEFDDLDEHPAATYATGKFELAYLYDTVTKEISARAMTIKDPPYYVRVYGSEEVALHDKLAAAGYERRSSWRGERLLFVGCPYDTKRILPYIDGGEQEVGLIQDDDGKRYWAIGGHRNASVTLTANSQDGYVDEDPTPEGYCDACDSNVDEDPDDMEYSHYHGIRIGHCCIDEYRQAVTSSSRRNTDWVHEDNCILCEDDDNYYAEEAYSDHDIVYCEYSGEYRFASNCVEDISGNYVLEEDAIDVGGHHIDIVHDPAMLLKCVYNMSTEKWCFIDECQEYVDAPRYVDDFGNEFVAGFFSPRLTATYYDVNTCASYLRRTFDIHIPRHLHPQLRSAI